MVREPTSTIPGALRRDLGVTDAVVIGLGSMIGAGVFVVFGPAARAAGSGLLIGLAIAAVVAFCNAHSSAKLAALHPSSGGTYVYGRERLGEFWGYLAGWGFVVGKTTSCVAMALTVGAYTWPAHAHLVAAVAALCLTAVDYFGVRKSAWFTRIVVLVVLVVLSCVALSAATSGTTSLEGLVTGSHPSVIGVLQSAGLVFFAFAGYARIATLGEEVRDPARTIPRAVPIALGITLFVYSAVAIAALAVLGSQRLADSSAPLRDAVIASGSGWMSPLVGVGATAAALGSLLSLLLGVSRTSLAMARDGHLPSFLAVVHPRYGVPHRAELVIGVGVALLAALVDLGSAIGFSSFAVLVYYAVTNASALTLASTRGGAMRLVPVVGLAGCTVLALCLPWQSVLCGVLAFAIGIGIYAVRRAPSPPAPASGDQ